MALGKLPSSRLEILIQERLLTQEDVGTASLIEWLRAAGKRGYLTTGEFQAACRWKSPRSSRHVARNSHHRIRSATRIALGDAADRTRIDALLMLHGVSVPTASAILTLLDPVRYGVIDIRVWQLLHELGLVDGNRSGTGLTVSQWEQFLEVVRRYSAQFQVSARDIERALFAVHRDFQEGTLYRR